MAEFGIDVKIAPKGDGLKVIERDLEGVEKKAKTTAATIEQGLTRALKAESAALQGAKVACDGLAKAEQTLASALKEERMWAEAAAKAERDHAAALRATEDASRKAAAGVDAYDKALKENASATTPKAVSALDRMAGGWKGVMQVVGNVGNSMNAVRMGIDLATKAVELSGDAARKAAAGWREFHRGAGNRAADEMTQGREALARDKIGYVPDSLHGVIYSPTSTHAQVVAAVDAYQGSVQERQDKAMRAGQSGIVRDRMSSAVSTSQNLEKQLADQIAAEERILSAGGRLTKAMLDAHARLDREIEKFNAELTAVEAAFQQYGSTGLRNAEVVDEFGQLVPLSRSGATSQRSAQKRQAGPGAPDNDFYGRLGDRIAARLAEIARVSAEVQARKPLQFTPEALGDTSASDRLASGYMPQSAVRDIEQITAVAEGSLLIGLSKSEEAVLKLADAFSGPLAGAMDGLIDGLVRWEMQWQEWGQAALAEIAKVAARLALLELGTSIGGKWGKFFTLLGGGSLPVPGGGGSGGGTGSSSRMAPSDPFGRPDGGSGAVWREPVMQRQAPGGGAGGGGEIHVKVVNTFDPATAMREVLSTKEGERIVVNHVQNNSGALGLRR